MLGSELDIFYYWKNYASDIKEGRIGTLGAEDDKLERILEERKPTRVWTFLTPKGMKGKIQVLGSMVITNQRPDNFVPKWRHNLFYDAASPKSVLFTDSKNEDKIREVTEFFNNRYQASFRSNFQGEKGVLEMEMDAVRGFDKLVQDYPKVQFLEGIKK